MSKKKFLDGLDSLFGAPSSEEVLEKEGLFESTTPQRKKLPKKKRIRGESTTSRKTFTTDLDSLFQEVLNESIEEEMKKARKNNPAPVKAEQKEVKKPKRVFRKPMSGLDALIRNTVETSQMKMVEAPEPTKKRVTFVFDKQKLMRLKKIAKIEKAYLKDIIGNLVSEYIQQYETDEKPFKN